MKKIQIKICLGTTCYVMGASDLQMISEYIPEEYSEKIEISGSTCLDYCFMENQGKPPFVEIDGEVLSEATIEGIIDKIKTKIPA